MNWFMVAVGGMQMLAGAWSFYTSNPRMGIANLCVATANFALAGSVS